MNKQQRGLIVLIVILFLAAAFFWNRSRIAASSQGAGSENEDLAGTQLSGNVSSQKFKDAQGKLEEKVISRPATPEELVSLRKMTDILAGAVLPGANEAELLKTLRGQGQAPSVAADNNPVTGDMDIIRTQNPLVGTRYFHSQFFGDNKGEKFLQHISFEFRPGPQALQQAISAMQVSLHVGQPEEIKPNFYQWTMENGYCAWVSPLDEKDMENHPFNAYSAQDKGSIRVAVELCNQEDE